METLDHFFQIEILQIKVWVYLAALGSITAGFVGKKIAAMLFNYGLRIASKTSTQFDDVFIIALSKPVEWAIVLAGIFVALTILPLPEDPINIARFVDAVLKSASLMLIMWFLTRLVDGATAWWGEKAATTESRLDDQLVPIVRKSLKAFLYIVGVVLILQNLGYSVQSLLAGLGIGGLAVAMAAKDTVANLFGSIIIFLDKPFQVGDWIDTTAGEGTVEEIGLRTTRIRTFANSQISVPNAFFTGNAVNNWSKMKKRRIMMNIGVTYSSSVENVDGLVHDIRDLISANPKIRDDFFLVNFDKFGASSLDILVYCFTETTNWSEFLQAKQEFMLDIMKKVRARGLNFAFPSQSIYVETLPGEPEAMTSQRPK